MRKIGLLSVLLFSMFAVTFAQEEEQDWRQVFPRNEFSLGIGDPAFANLQRGSIWEKLLWCHFDRYQSDNLGNWFDPGIYHSNYIATCPISLGYMYRLRKFLWLGGSVSYMGVFGKVFDARDDSFLYNHTETQIAFLPAVRFSYLNKKYVTLYSGLSTGFLLNFEKENGSTDVYFHPTFQLTAFGVSVGRKFFGYTEVGVGYKGFITAGIGYRFNAKKND